MSTTRARLYFAVFGASIVAAAACGARTGLDVPEPPRPRVDAGPDVEDAGPDADAGPDVEDAGPDVIDAPDDVPVVNDCTDAGVTYIYVVSEQNELFAFYPPDLSLKDIGTISCPDTGSPYSMAVDRDGIAYVVFTPTGNLYRVSTLTASCKPTAYKPGFFGPNGETFGMGFSADTADPGETLYIASDDPSNGGPQTPEQLGTIDVTTFQRSTVGKFSHVIGSAELTGTGDGRLYGFGVDDTQAMLSLVQIDKTNADILSTQPLLLPGGPQALVDWAFAFWGGDFYFFTSTQAQASNGPNAATTIYRYTPGSTSPELVHVLDIPGVNIDGAGVSTCAPQQ